MFPRNPSAVLARSLYHTRERLGFQARNAADETIVCSFPTREILLPRLPPPKWNKASSVHEILRSCEESKTCGHSRMHDPYAVVSATFACRDYLPTKEILTESRSLDQCVSLDRGFAYGGTSDFHVSKQCSHQWDVDKLQRSNLGYSISLDRTVESGN